MAQSKITEVLTKESWMDISNEKERTYFYPNTEVYGDVIVVNPLKVWIPKDSTKGHRIICKDGIGWYIKPGWNAICWLVKEGEENVSF